MCMQQNIRDTDVEEVALSTKIQDLLLVKEYSLICVLSPSVTLLLSDGWMMVMLGPRVLHNKLLQAKVELCC